MHSVFYRILSHSYELRQITFIYFVDTLIFKYADDLHMHGSVRNFPLVDVSRRGAHAHDLLLDAVGKLFMALFGKYHFKGFALQQFSQLVDLVDVLICDLLHCHGFIIVRNDKTFRLQHPYCGAHGTPAHAEFFCEHSLSKGHSGRVAQIQDI